MSFRLILGGVALAAVTAMAQTQNLAADLQRAKQREQASGDCKTVLAEYVRISGQAAKIDPATAAEALLRAARCREQDRDGAPIAPSRQLAWSKDRSIYVLGNVTRDGRSVPFSTRFRDREQLFIRDLVTGVDRRVTDTPIAGVGVIPWDTAASFSPDGNRLAYGWNRNDQAGGPYEQEVRIVDLAGSSGVPTPRTVFTAQPGSMLYPHDWAPDQSFIAMEILRSDVLLIGLLSLKDSSFRELRTLPPNSRPGNGESLFVSPDGKYLAYDVVPPGKPGRDIVVMDVATAAEVATVDHAADDALIGWAPDGGGILFVSDRTGNWTLWLSRFAPGSPLGQARPIAKDLNPIDIALGVTDRGDVFSLKKSRASNEVKVSTIDFAKGEVTSGPAEIATEYLGTNSNPVWSPDLKSIAYLSTRGTPYVPRVVIVIQSLFSKESHEVRPELTSAGGQALWTPDGRHLILPGEGKNGPGLYSVELQTGATTLVIGGRIFGPSNNSLKLPFHSRSLSPDGARLYYQRGTKANASIVERRLASGVERVLCSGTEADLSADASHLYCLNVIDGRDHQIIEEMNLADNTMREIVTPPATRQLWLSPDGAFAFVAGESFAQVLSIRTTASALPMATRSGQFIGWSPDSKALLLANGDDVLWAPIDGRPSRKLAGLGAGGRFVLSPDGRRIAQTYAIPPGRDEIWILRGLSLGTKGGQR